MGNLLSLTVDHSGTTADVLHTYTYDALNRLATAKAQVGTAPPQYNYTYTYDELGNIDQRSGTGGTWDYLYHGTIKQRLQQVTGYALHTTIYDGNGNLTSYKIGSTQHTLVYDAENRLTSVTVGGQTTTFYYMPTANESARPTPTMRMSIRPSRSLTKRFQPVGRPRSGAATSSTGNYWQFAG